MKIIGNGHNCYICEITLDEIKKVFEKCYVSDEAIKYKLNIKVGNEIKLSEGYNFLHDITEVCDKMISAQHSFKEAHKTLLSFAEMVAERSEG